MKSVLMRPPHRAYSIRPRCVNPRLPPSPTTFARSSVARRRARPSFVRSPASALRLFGRLHVGADPAVPQQVDRRLQDPPDQLRPGSCRRAPRRDPERGADLGSRASRSSPPGPRRSPPADSDRSVVVVPRRARQLEQPFAFGERDGRRRGSGRGRRAGGRTRPPAGSCPCSSIPLPKTSPDMSPMPDRGERVAAGRRCPARRKCRFTDSHAPRAVMPSALWSIPREPPLANASPEPEPVPLAAPRSPYRRTSPCPCRRRPPGRCRRPSSTRTPSGCTTSPSTWLSVMSSRPCMKVTYWATTSAFSSSGAAGAALQDEAALRAVRHDDRVLDPLRLHQAEDLGAVVLLAVGPADAAAGDHAAAQVDRLHLRRIHEDLEQRERLRHLGNVRRPQLDDEGETRPGGRRSCAPWPRSCRAASAGSDPGRATRPPAGPQRSGPLIADASSRARCEPGRTSPRRGPRAGRRCAGSRPSRRCGTPP